MTIRIDIGHMIRGSTDRPSGLADHCSLAIFIIFVMTATMIAIITSITAITMENPGATTDEWRGRAVLFLDRQAISAVLQLHAAYDLISIGRLDWVRDKRKNVNDRLDVPCAAFCSSGWAPRYVPAASVSMRVPAARGPSR
jgi:hypothetical protein